MTGTGKLVALGNGNQQSHTPFKGKKMEAYLGKCLAIVQSTDEKGAVTITARSAQHPVAKATVKAE